MHSSQWHCCRVETAGIRAPRGFPRPLSGGLPSPSPGASAPAGRCSLGGSPDFRLGQSAARC